MKYQDLLRLLAQKKLEKDNTDVQDRGDKEVPKNESPDEYDLPFPEDDDDTDEMIAKLMKIRKR